LILVTNDDGISSPGLHAAAGAVAGLGDLLIMAPSTQQTSAGRSYPPVCDQAIYPTEIPLGPGGPLHPAYHAPVSPAQAVLMAQLDLAPRPIDLCVSGINYGENIGSGITISGTVGAAIEAVSLGIPALAVSQEVHLDFHYNHSDQTDFTAAMSFTTYFARQMLAKGLPPGVDLLKIDVPEEATPDTPWQAARVSRQRYYMPLPSGRTRLDEQKRIAYRVDFDAEAVEPDSDISLLAIAKKVAVVPITVDLTAPVSLGDVAAFFEA
jgi:5'-nucleotidase